MAKLSQDEVRHIARLARLHLSEKEVEKYSRELTSILQSIEMLKEVDTSRTEATAQVTGLTNVFREDEIKETGITREQLLNCSPLPIIENQIQTPSAHG